jgi:hypothetical protein
VLRRLTPGVVGALLLAVAGCGDGTAIFQLEVGDCVADVSAQLGPVEDLPITPCTSPHDAEVVGIFHHDDAPRIPDDIRTDTTAGCAELFEAYVGIPPAVSSLGLAYVDPSPESWEAGDRDSTCLATVGEGEQDIVRSVAGEGEDFIGVHVDDPANQPDAIACMTGSFTACDDLYQASPADSTEELVAATCGGRIPSEAVENPGHCELTLGG